MDYQTGLQFYNLMISQNTGFKKNESKNESKNENINMSGFWFLFRTSTSLKDKYRNFKKVFFI